jgi:hypothetical protein
MNVPHSGEGDSSAHMLALCGHPEPDAGAVLPMTRANILAINDSSDDFHAVWTVELE